jgi:hypothetical protein
MPDEPKWVQNEDRRESFRHGSWISAALTTFAGTLIFVAIFYFVEDAFKALGVVGPVLGGVAFAAVTSVVKVIGDRHGWWD